MLTPYAEEEKSFVREKGEVQKKTLQLISYSNKIIFLRLTCTTTLRPTTYQV